MTNNGQTLVRKTDGSGLAMILDARGEVIADGVRPDWAEEMLPYAKGPIAFKLGQGNLEWSDTPVGYRAACRVMATLPRDNSTGDCRTCAGTGQDGGSLDRPCNACQGSKRTWPPMRLAFRYTVERVVYETRERYAHPGFPNGGLACGTHYRKAIIQWSKRIDETGGE